MSHDNYVPCKHPEELKGLNDVRSAGSRVATDGVAQRWLYAASDHAPKWL